MMRRRDAIPSELRELPQWVGWRWEERDGKRTKPPCTADGSRPASCDDPSTWSPFEAVVGGVEAGRLSGVGFQVQAGQPYTGIDLDHCRDAETGHVEPWAAELVDRFHSYAEVSPSGTGVRVFIRATKPGPRCRKGAIEVYDRARYLTVTGQHLTGTPLTIEDRQAQLDALYAELWPAQPVPNGHAPTVGMGAHAATAQEVIALASQARNGAKFAALMRGETSAYGDDDSAADLALCSRAAFYSRDPGVIDAVLRQSGLYRDKWERGDYRERTIAQALAGVTESYEPPKTATGGNGTGPRAEVAARAPGEPRRADALREARSDAAAEPPLTDLGNAQRLVDAHGDRLRYDHTAARWHVWDTIRWRPDADAEVTRAAAAVIRDQYDRAWDTGEKEAAAHALRSQQRQRLEAMIALAQALRPVAVSAEAWDRDPYLLNVANGTLDLRSGLLRPHRPDDLLTQLAPVVFDPAASAPRWLAFLEQIFAGDHDLIGFVQRGVGLSLIGRVLEHVLFLGYGSGANGKTTFLTVLQRLLGDYARQADPELLLAHREASHPTGIADLRGARFVCASEVDDGRRFAEATLKALTGGDLRKARFMRQDFFQYEPSDTLWLAANHRPQVRGTDLGLWRRVKLLPFTVTIPPERQDPKLVETLLAEGPGILRWALEGCRAYQADGLGTAAAVEVATAEYRAAEDVLGAFLADRCLIDPDRTVGAGDLYRAYTEWAASGGERPVTQTRFGTQLSERGFERERERSHRGGKVYHGLALASLGHEPEPDPLRTVRTVAHSSPVSSPIHARVSDEPGNRAQPCATLRENSASTPRGHASAAPRDDARARARAADDAEELVL